MLENVALEKIQAIQKIYENVTSKDLTAREKRLTELLFSDRTVKKFNDLPNGKYRILQFVTENFAELSNTLELLLPDFVKSDKSEHLVIERFSGENLTKSELFEVLQILSQDTGEEISAYIGLFSEKSELNEIYKEELLAFKKNQTFSEFIISGALVNTDSLILAKIRKDLLDNPEEQKLVKALYRTSGNQAQAAKVLYVHRNTLLNKIKKYEQKYGLQLTGSDLVLAYNLL